MRAAAITFLILGVGCGTGPDDSHPLGPVTLPQYFPAGSTWTDDIAQAPVDPESPAIIAGLDQLGGFGDHGQIRIDFELEVVTSIDDLSMRTFMPNDGFYTPDCDQMPVPVPPIGAIEGEPGYACVDGGDCHLLVHDLPTGRLYEMWRADVRADAFMGGCLAVWDLSKMYGPTGRGPQCTSADAAGLPIVPLLATADEGAAGHIDHALRFVLPNDRIRQGVYVAPATHSTDAATGGPGTPPFGARLRLRADYPVHKLPSRGARLIAEAMQRYGMFLSDGGGLSLTVQSDRFTSYKWTAGKVTLLGPRDLAALRITDFQMVDAGDRIPYTGKCVRNSD